MPEWLTPVITLSAAVVGSSALTAFVTLYFTRERTGAEAGKLKADAHKVDAEAGKVDAEAMAVYVAEIREGFTKWKAAVDDWAECVKEKAEALAGKAEALAENVQLRKTIEILRQENVEKDRTITELHGRRDV